MRYVIQGTSTNKWESREKVRTSYVIIFVPYVKKLVRDKWDVLF